MKMEDEVQFTAKQFIKPSSPTPLHLRHYQNSFLDQITPHVYNPMVFFFDSTPQFDTVENISKKLRKSLSEVLVQYYPLAGRFMHECYVECNDEGVPFVEAKMRCQLADFIRNPVHAELNKLVPYDFDALADLPLCVQLTFFDCGGIAIGAAVSHRIADALSYFTFVNAWAKVARNNGGMVHGMKVEFTSSKLFPPKDMSWYDPNFYIAKDRDIISKRFVFDASSIEALRTKFDKATACMQSPKPPSRVETLSAFIWSRFVAVTRSKTPEPQTLNVVTYTINLRPRMEPPLPDYSFGNYFSSAAALLTVQKGEDQHCYDFIKQVREQIKNIDNEYVKKLQGQEYLNHMKESLQRKRTELIRIFNFTSLCRFPLYDADFGWGRPIWVGPPARKFRNTVVFMDTRNGGGIEAYICLALENMAKFENDKEFLAYVC